MIQLILDTTGYNISLPESQKGGYNADLQPYSVDVEMITGRMVRELRGNVWVISYQYGYFDDKTKNNVLEAVKKGRNTPIKCGFLPPDSTKELKYSDFFVTSFTYPKFMWSRKVPGKFTDNEGQEISGNVPVPMWADFSLTLREVKPSD